MLMSGKRKRSFFWSYFLRLYHEESIVPLALSFLLLHHAKGRIPHQRSFFPFNGIREERQSVSERRPGVRNQLLINRYENMMLVSDTAFLSYALDVIFPPLEP